MTKFVLVACEESQRVTIALRNKGIKAWSCDILECSGGKPQWHLKGNVLDWLNEEWDDIIAFPPCTYLTKASASRIIRNGIVNKERYEKLVEARKFFLKLWNAKAKRIAIENPVPLAIAGLPPYTQIIQPYMFGDPWIKTTCLWLKGYDYLEPTKIVTPQGHWINTSSSPHGHARDPKIRSKTFPGVAAAMADQWYE